MLKIGQNCKLSPNAQQRSAPLPTQPTCHIFALLISMPRFNSINFYQNRPNIKLFSPKKDKIFERWGLHHQTSLTTTIADFSLRACVYQCTVISLQKIYVQLLACVYQCIVIACKKSTKASKFVSRKAFIFHICF